MNISNDGYIYSCCYSDGDIYWYRFTPSGSSEMLQLDDCFRGSINGHVFIGSDDTDHAFVYNDCSTPDEFVEKIKKIMHDKRELRKNGDVMTQRIQELRQRRNEFKQTHEYLEISKKKFYSDLK